VNPVSWQLWFAIYSSWSGVPVYEDWTLATFNVLFTNLQPLAIGVFDRVADSDTMMRYPALYKLSQDRSAFSVRVFMIWMIQGMLHSVILYFLTMALFAQGELSAHTHTHVYARRRGARERSHDRLADARQQHVHVHSGGGESESGHRDGRVVVADTRVNMGLDRRVAGVRRRLFGDMGVVESYVWYHPLPPPTQCISL
jgi:hypothetical protein